MLVNFNKPAIAVKTEFLVPYGYQVSDETLKGYLDARSLSSWHPGLMDGHSDQEAHVAPGYHQKRYTAYCIDQCAYQPLPIQASFDQQVIEVHPHYSFEIRAAEYLKAPTIDILFTGNTALIAQTFQVNVSQLQAYHRALLHDVDVVNDVLRFYSEPANGPNLQRSRSRNMSVIQRATTLVNQRYISPLEQLIIDKAASLIDFVRF